MKIIIKSAVALFVTAAACGIATLVPGQDYSETPWPPTSWEWPDNNFTNKIAVPTASFYTNTEEAIANDQQYRVREEGGRKGAAALQSGPRIEPRPPTTYLQTDPWVQPDHAWDMNPNAPYLNEALGDTNNTVVDDTLKR
ncbi:MAG TPA: hypothetical protein VMF08_11740 [Candidatus Sulfotelmatobacter sp.]|nr:hypothetical protein [Candidatus Sulfotelmatobacter sp.]